MVLSSPPKIFGAFHIGWLIAILTFNVLIYHLLKNKSQDKLIKVLHNLGIIMIIGEVWKQYYFFAVINQGSISLWFFPWQLCSMAMYLSFLLPFLKGRVQEAALVFLATFSLFAALIALLIPSDMLRPQLLFASHGFIYHGLMIAESILAILIIKKRKDLKFLPSLIMFLIMALIAEIINILSYAILKDIYIAPNMFYITPYYETTQVGLNLIAWKLGILPEIIIYLGGIILFSYLIFRLIIRFSGQSQDRS